MDVNASSLLAVAVVALAAPDGGVEPASPSPRQAAAEDTSHQQGAREELRVGLALSGGSARGLAHAGVLHVLEEAGVRVDAVAGTSIGAVVGGLYAAGHRAAGLDSIARSVDWGRLFGEDERPVAALSGLPAPAERHQLALPVREWKPRLPSGLISGQRVTQLVARLTWRVHDRASFRDFPVPFMALATDVETGEPVRLTSGSLPLAVRSSMAIPSIFTPVRLRGRTLIDGGVSRNLPAAEVRSMGVDRVICSDVTEPPRSADSLHSFLDVLRQTMSYRTVADVRRQRRRCDVLIRPKVEGMSGFDFGAVEEWIRRGRRAAREKRSSLRRMARSQTETLSASPPPMPSDSVVLSEVSVPDLSSGRAAYLVRLLDLPTSRPTTVDRVDRAVERLHAVGLLARVSYVMADLADTAASRVDGPPRRRLEIQTEERGRDELRIGVRATSHENAAVLLSSRLHHTTGFGSVTEADLRLGDELMFELRQRMRPYGSAGFLLGGRAGYRRTPVELPSPDGAAPPLESAFETLDGELFAGLLLGSHGVVGGEVGVEWYEEDPAAGSPRQPAGGWLGRGGGVVRWDSRDRTVFPRGGVRVEVRADRLEPLSGDVPAFSQLYGEGTARIPLGDRWSAWGGATVGATGGDPPPLYRQFFLGGTLESFVFPRHRITFPGLRVRELRGTHFQKARAGLQVEVLEDVFLQGAWAGGEVRDGWRWDPSEWEHGGRLTAGARTPFGSVRLSVAEATAPGGPRLELDLGGRF